MPTEAYEWGLALAKYTTADQSITSTSATDITGLSWDVDANIDYQFSFLIAYSAASTTHGAQFAVACPASPTWISYLVDMPSGTSDTTTAFTHGSGVSSGDLVVVGGVPVANTIYIARIEGVLRNGVNAGTLKVQAAMEGASQTVTLRQASGGVVIPRS